MWSFVRGRWGNGMKCPNCGSTHLFVEKKPNGIAQCRECNLVGPQHAFGSNQTVLTEYLIKEDQFNIFTSVYAANDTEFRKRYPAKPVIKTGTNVVAVGV